mgnify:CR=1|tara:strand:+ start:148 stop:639 length:492 start_codon:yes stop_codon:yes gene_type:complete
MADSASMNLNATILNNVFRKTLTNLNFSVVPNADQGWVIKIVNVTTSSADLLGADSVVQSAGKASATALETSATGDLVKFLFIKNTGTTDGSTGTNESVYIVFDGGAAAHNATDALEIPAGMSFYCKPHCDIASLHVISGDSDASSAGEGVIQCVVAAIIEEA